MEIFNLREDFVYDCEEGEIGAEVAGIADGFLGGVEDDEDVEEGRVGPS